MDKILENINEEKTKKCHLKSLFLQTAFASFSSALLSYVFSSYLLQFIDEKYISLVYIIPSIISIILIYFFGRIIKRIGLFKSAMINSLLIIISAFCQVFLNNIIAIILTVIIYQISAGLFWVFIDYYIEKYSDDSTTGNTKAIEWTIYNVIFILGPICAGLFKKYFNFEFIFLISALFILPSLFIFIKDFKKVKIETKAHIKIKLKNIYNNKAVFKISLTSFILNFFYAWMSIYTPIYMNKVLNLDWDKIGIIIAIILIPFLIFQYPAGKLADKYLGEKEILIFGIIVMGLSTIALFFTNNVIYFTMFLFMTRIGASLVEITREIYLYKNLDSENIDFISFYKMMPSFAYIIGPFIGSLILTFFKIQYLYLFLGFIVLISLTWLWKLKDTKVNFKSKFLEM